VVHGKPWIWGSACINTKHVAFERNYSLLLVSVMLHVSALLIDHHQAYKYVYLKHISMYAGWVLLIC
jgi:hypothetical protein